MALEYQINQREMAQLFKKLDSLPPIKRASVAWDAMNHVGNLMERKLKTNVSGPILKRRSGRMAQSIGNRVFANSTGITAVIGSGVRTGRRVKYANIHETGGVIRAKKAKFLTVPTSHAQTKAGVPRKAKARDWPDTFIMRTKSGDLMIMQKRGKNKIIPLYKLVKSVKVPARNYLSKSLIQMQKRIMVVLRSHIERGLRNGR